MGQSRDLAVVVDSFEIAEAAIAPIYSAEHALADKHFQSRESIVTVDDPDLEKIRMQNVLAKFSRTPRRVRWAGKQLVQCNETIYAELGIPQEGLKALAADGAR